jgi:hypothetical protein
MSNSQQVTGTSDPLYNLVSVYYHALKAAADAQQYIQDAQQAGDQQLVQFFQQSQQNARWATSNLWRRATAREQGQRSSRLCRPCRRNWVHHPASFPHEWGCSRGFAPAPLPALPIPRMSRRAASPSSAAPPAWSDDAARS